MNVAHVVSGLVEAKDEVAFLLPADKARDVLLAALVSDQDKGRRLQSLNCLVEGDGLAHAQAFHST